MMYCNHSILYNFCYILLALTSLTQNVLLFHTKITHGFDSHEHKKIPNQQKSSLKSNPSSFRSQNEPTLKPRALYNGGLGSKDSFVSPLTWPRCFCFSQP